ncbi:hypothetical protein A8L34_27695 [Bacillus sp. FJAT-27264]|uniref:hypothetical protein n=1 Tax=Paenibacillus sp. (strain DSM 101736 / FJAT-27264) TaxID=1850362 RepID=UPI000808100B|nr:hypothetical protein [Bacillus sp. FJAT-27264]OBZ15835.1 hypothetical protein A8L34_27695 [Bacillus sp. FJAT-27264]
MKKYRLGYDFVFITGGSFHYKDDFIGAMSVYVLFKVFNANGEELFFESDELKEQKLYFEGGSCYVSSLLSCSFDTKNILNFNPNTPLLEKFKGELKIQWEIDGYTKDIDEGILEPKFISESEFMDIMKNNINAFNISDNYSAQSTSYFTQEAAN